jgi:hypothetical protein
MIGLICWLGASSGRPSLHAQEKNPDVVGSRPSTMPGNQYGSDSSVYAARIAWQTPNDDWDAR